MSTFLEPNFKGAMEATKDLTLSSKITTNEAKFIEIQQIKLKYFLIALPETFQPPNVDRMLVTSPSVQHFLKHNILSLIFNMKHNQKKHFVIIMNHLVQLISTINYNQAMAVTPSSEVIERVCNSKIITISTSGQLLIHFEDFTLSMFALLSSVLTIEGDVLEVYVEAFKELYEDDYVFEASIQLQLLLAIIDNDVYQLEQVISLAHEDSNMKQMNVDDNTNDLHANIEATQENMEVPRDNEMKSANIGDDINQQAFNDDIPIGFIHQHGKHIPNLNIIDISTYKQIMNIAKSWKPIKNETFIAAENIKLMSDEHYRMQAVVVVSAAIKNNKMKFIEDTANHNQTGFDYDLQEVSVNTIVISNVNLYQLTYCGPGLTKDVMQICDKYHVVLTDTELMNLGQGSVNRILNFDNNEEGELRTGCIKLAIKPVLRTTLYGVFHCKSRKTDSKKIHNTTFKERQHNITSPIYGITFCSDDENDDQVVVAAIRGITDHDVNYVTCRIKQHLNELIGQYPVSLRIVIATLWIPFIDHRQNVMHTTCITAIVLIDRNHSESVKMDVQRLFFLATSLKTSTITVAHATLEIKPTIKQFNNVPLTDRAMRRNRCLRITNMTYVTPLELLVGVEKVVKPQHIKSIFYEQDYEGSPITYYLELDHTYPQALTLVVDLDEHAFPNKVIAAEFKSLLPPINSKHPFQNLFQITAALLYKPNIVLKNTTSKKK